MRTWRWAGLNSCVSCNAWRTTASSSQLPTSPVTSRGSGNCSGFLGLLRLPMAAIESVAPVRFNELLGPWHASGRGLIVDGVQSVDAVTRLFDLKVGYVQGDALAAGGPRLDYEFTQIGV